MKFFEKTPSVSLGSIGWIPVLGFLAYRRLEDGPSASTEAGGAR